MMSAVSTVPAPPSNPPVTMPPRGFSVSEGGLIDDYIALADRLLKESGYIHPDVMLP